VSRPSREVRLSRAGKVFVGFTLAIGFAAVNTGNNVLFLLVSLMLAIMILSGVAALVNLWRIELRILPGQLLSAGQPGFLHMELRNDRPWGAWLLEFELGSVRSRWPYLGARDRVRVALPWTAAERGQPPLPQLLLGSSFPFAFVWRGHYRASPREDWPWVAPAHGHWDAQAQPERAEGALPDHGAHGQGDILYLRPREEREPLQRVLWRRSVWQGVELGFVPYLPVVEREQDGDEKLWILDWDAPALAALDTEERLRALRAGLDEAAAKGESWRLRLPNLSLDGRASQGLERALEALARQQPWPEYAPVQQPRRAGHWRQTRIWWRDARTS